MRAMVLVGAGLLISSTAFADGDPPGDMPPVDSEWSSEIGNRSLITPEGKLEIHGGIPIVEVTGTSPTGIVTHDTTELLSLGASFGVIPKLELGADYSAILHPNASAGGLLTFHGAYLVLHRDKLDIAAAGALTFNLDGSTKVGLSLGAWLRYRITRMFSVFTGNNGIPTALAGLTEYFQPPPVGYQLAIGFNNNQPVTFAFPVGVGIQATPNIYAFFATEVANIWFANGQNGKRGEVLFADFIPVSIGGFYSMAKFDAGIVFADDLKAAGDDYIITFVGRYYIK